MILLEEKEKLKDALSPPGRGTVLLSEEIGVAEIAEKWGCSRRHVQRRLLAIEKDHPGTITRRGSREEIRVKPEALAKLVAEPVPEARHLVDQRLLRGRVKELEERVDALVRERVEQQKEDAKFRSISNGWFRRIQVLEDKLNR